jgi:uncharacterized protein with NRDE domain
MVNPLPGGISADPVMCTLSLIAAQRRIRLAFNRDESPNRSAGLPPSRRRVGAREAVFPIDPVSGGTWLAVNDAGLALAVLNVYASDGHPNPGRRSRGEIIPGLLESDSPTEAVEAFSRRFAPHDFSPFRLVVVNRESLAVLKWNGRHLVLSSRFLGDRPELFTSSGLGDELVEGPRRELFEQLVVASTRDRPQAQDAFHAHRWEGREHVSVNMRRSTARTVSFAVVELDDDAALFTYHPAAPDCPTERTVILLPLTVREARP